MPQAPKTDRKEKLIEAAFKLMQSHGVSGLRLADIAKQAKVPAPLIHYYFQDLDDLHYEVILKLHYEILDDNIREAEKNREDPLRWFQEYLYGPLLWANQNPQKMAIWLYFYHLAARSERFERLNTEMSVRGRERIALILYEGVEKKVFKIPEGMNVQDTAKMIQSMIVGITITSASEIKTKSIEDWGRILQSSVLSLLGIHGLRPLQNTGKK